MITIFFRKLTIITIILYLLCSNNVAFSQKTNLQPANSAFWQRVRFGGSVGLSFGDFTNITVAPSAVYVVNDYFSTGFGLLGSYVSVRNTYQSTLLGGSLISLFNPVKEVQLSAEIEQLHVAAVQQFATTPLGTNGSYSSLQTGAPYELQSNFWTTALFIGGGYTTGNVTVGGRYNVLFNKNKSAYSSAFIPFVRVFF